MAGLIKGQILKHLSKFVKNLSPSQINLSTLKGEGELSNLELNVEVLGELLELPSWIRLTRATCNRAAIRIQWTKLKTVPIQLSLDEIRVAVETCEELRSGGENVAPVLPPTQAYGFTEKIVDGITVTVNLVHVSLTSLAFTASFQMSRIVVESRGPNWQRAALPSTRLKDLEKGEVLTFKELSWQTVRIEARSSVQEDLTSLRLITNQARCRITLKKRISDCAILGARIVLILDDLLWVLTDDQLKAALHFIGSISGLVRSATEKVQKAKAARKLEHQKSTSEAAAGVRRSSAVGGTGGSRTFRKYDVIETSYHFYSDRIDLHFCDDPGGGRSDHPELAGGGAFQVSLAKLQLDYYPYHLARGERKHWVRYPADSPHRAWLQSGLAQFDTRLLDELLSGQNKAPLSRSGRAGGSSQGMTAGEEGLRDLVVSQLSRMMVAAVVVRLADFTLWKVSTATPNPGRGQSVPSELVRGDMARLHLPPDLPLLHLELSNFYYPGHHDFPLPPPCLLLTANPITVWLDILTLVWLNAFTVNLQKSVTELQRSLQLDEGDASYANIKVEAVMPRVIVSSRGPIHCPSPLRPDSLQVSASKVSLANYRSRDTGSRADLAAALDKFQQSSLFFGAAFPSRPSDPAVVHQKLITHATGEDCLGQSNGGSAFRRDLLWTEARDVWHCAVDSVWAEFHLPGLHRPLPLLDAAPLQAWIYLKPEGKRQVNKDIKGEMRPARKILTEFYGSKDNEDDNVGVHVLALAPQLVSLQLDHYQLLFLLRVAEALGELGAFLASDSSRIVDKPSGLVLGAVLPQVDLSVILPAETQAGETVSEAEVSLLDKTVEEEPVVDPLVGARLVEAPSHPLACDTSHPLQSSPVHKSSPLEGGSVAPLSSPQPPSSSQPGAQPPASEPAQPEQVPRPQPPPKLTLCPTMSSNGLTPELASALDRLQPSLSPSNPQPPTRRGLWGMFGEAQPPRSSARSPDLDIDSLSVRSDDSGESSWTDMGDSISVATEGDTSIGEGLFRVERDDDSRLGGVSPCLEVAEEVMGEGSLPDNEPAERLVSVLTIHLGRLAAAQVSGSGTSSLLLTADSVGFTEADVQDYAHFQFRFGQSGKAWSETTLRKVSAPAIALRLDSKPPGQPAKALADLPEDLELSWGERIARATEGALEAEISHLSLSANSSVLAKLGDWVQDEVVPAPLPTTLTISNLSLQVNDDKPPMPGYPAPPPLDVNVVSLRVTRDREGVVKVEQVPVDKGSPQVPASSQSEAELRAALEAAREEVRVLRGKLAREEMRAKEEEGKAKVAALEKVQAEGRVDGLVKEKKSLLDTLKYLQEELLKSGKK